MRVLIEKIVYPGKSLSLGEGKAIFTDEGLPGEIVEVEQVKEKTNYIQAKTTKILRESGHRVESRCPHYKACSPYQFMDYPFQVEIKKSQIQEIFSHQLKIELKNLKFAPSPKVWGYRNKVRLHVIREKETVSLAYHQPGREQEFVKIKDCFLLPEKMNSLLSSLARIIEEKNLGALEEVVIKQSASSGDMLVVLYLDSEKEIESLASNFAHLKSEFSIKGLVGLFRTRKGLKEKILEGRNFIEDKVADKVFRIGSQSFFQINLDMLQELIRDIKNDLNLSGKEKITDLYCGLGTFGLVLASKAQEVYGVESFPENIAFLKKNLILNRIGNFTICEGTSEEWISPLLKRDMDILIFDPPRKGISEQIVSALLRKPVPLLIYVSCNPSTLVRDLKRLSALYNLKDLHVYDFFPHTPHIETCVMLEKT